MKQVAHAPTQPCSHCGHVPTNTSIGLQITAQIEQLSPTERAQMHALIKQILAASQGQAQPPSANPAKPKRSSKRR